MRFSYIIVPLVMMPFLAAPSLAQSAAASADFNFASLIPPPAADFRFADTAPLRLALTDPFEEIRIRVLNQTTKEIKLRAKLDGELGGAFALDSDVVDLTAAGSAEIVVNLDVPAAGIAPGAYSGYLVLYCENAGKMARREIKLVVADRPPAPLVTEWQIDYWRWLPFSRDLDPRSHEGAYLPLAAPGDAAAKQLVGHLTSAKGDEAAVFTTIRNDTLESGYAGATLELTKTARFTSKYEGKIDFQPAREGGEVALTVAIKDHWLWAVLCLLAGIGLTLRIQRFFQVGRPISLARERDARLGDDFENKAQPAYQRKAGDGPYAGFSIAADLAKRRGEVQATLDQLLQDRPENLEQDDGFKDVQEKQERLEAAVASWPGFCDELAALEVALNGFTAAAAGLKRPALLSTAGSPSCARYARLLLQPGNLSIDGYETRRRDVADATAVLLAWPEVEQRVAIQRDTIPKLATPVQQNPLDQQTFNAARRDVLAIWDRLWRLETAEELEQQATALDSSRDQLAGLSHYLSSPRGLKTMNGGSTLLAVTRQRTLAAAGRRLEEPRDDRELLAYYGNRRRRYEWLTLWLALVLAVYTGLGQLYQGHDFATPWHYLGAFLWGAGTKLTIDTVVAGVGHLPALWKAVGRSA